MSAMGLGFLNLASEFMGRRHQDMFNRKAANVAFDREVMMHNWDVQLANSAHQREAADLQAAGLNRILTASRGGSGAAVPPAAHVPQAASATGGSNVDWAGSSAKSAQANLSEKQSELVDIQKKVASAEEAKLQSEAALNISMVPNAEAQRQLWAKQGIHFDASAKSLEQGIEESKQKVVESGARVKQIGQEIIQSKSQVLLNDAQRGKLAQDIGLIKAQTALSTAEKEKLSALQTRLLTKQEIDKSFIGEVLTIIDRLTGSLNPFKFGSN